MIVSVHPEADEELVAGAVHYAQHATRKVAEDFLAEFDHAVSLLREHPGLSSRYGELVAADGFRHLAVDHRHALRAGGYAVEHRDPFDRMLAAQSEIERLPLVTRDPAFALFGTRTCW